MNRRHVQSQSEKVAILLNPSAGRGKALKQKPRLETLLRRHDIPHDLFITGSEEELAELAREYPKKYKSLVGAGGDSTFNIIVDEIMRTSADVNFGMIGLGSSNDLTREFDLDSLEKACLALKNGRVRKIDLGCILKDGAPLRYFLGQANIGLGIFVNSYVEELAERRSRWGRIQTLAGILGILDAYRKKQVPISLVIESEEGKTEGKYTLAVFSNIRYWATGKIINPGAFPDDGFLDACLFQECSLGRLVRLNFLTNKGKHTKAQGITVLRSGWFKISSTKAFAVQTDGEIIGGHRKPELFENIEFRVIPGALKVICG